MPRQANAWGNMGNHNKREEILKTFTSYKRICMDCNNSKEYLGIDHVLPKTTLGDRND